MASHEHPRPAIGSSLGRHAIQDSRKPAFFALPAEIRCMIYEHVFGNSTTGVPLKEFAPDNRVDVSDRGPRAILFVSKQCRAILFVSKQCRAEASPLFWRTTTLEIPVSRLNARSAGYHFRRGLRRMHGFKSAAAHIRRLRLFPLPFSDVTCWKAAPGNGARPFCNSARLAAEFPSLESCELVVPCAMGWFTAQFATHWDVGAGPFRVLARTLTATRWGEFATRPAAPLAYDALRPDVRAAVRHLISKLGFGDTPEIDLAFRLCTLFVSHAVLIRIPSSRRRPTATAN